MKKCSKCQIDKPLAEFHKSSKRPGGFRPDCKSCRKQESLQRYAKKAEEIKKYQKKYALSNKESIKRTKSKYFQKNKKEAYVRNGQWREANRERDRKLKQDSANRLRQNRRKSQLKYHRKMMETSPSYRIICGIRSTLNNAVKTQRGNKTNSTIALLKCTVPELREHLESQFQPGMTWGNYGEWHIDHIRPLSSFDLTKESELQEAGHYTNLQPLWARDNLSKGARW